MLGLNKKAQSPGELFFLALYAILLVSILIMLFIYVVNFNYKVELHVEEQHAQEIALRIAQNPDPCLAYYDTKEGRLYPFVLDGNKITEKKGLSKCVEFNDPKIHCVVMIYSYEQRAGGLPFTQAQDFEPIYSYKFNKKDDVISATITRNMGKHFFLPVAIRYSDEKIMLGGVEVACRKV